MIVKLIPVFFLLNFLLPPGFSQERIQTIDPKPYWITAMDQPRADFSKAMASFEQFWKDKPIAREPFEDEAELEVDNETKMPQELEQDEMVFQYRRFMRWAILHQAFLDHDGFTRPDDGTLRPQSLHASNRSGITAEWTPTGPNSAIMNPLPIESRIGRMCQLQFHPHHPDTLYAISGSGGLFISRNAGQNWESTGTDQLPFGHQPASICIDYTDDRILYLGMGDANYASQGHGIWKSNDGGISWFDVSGPLKNLLVYEILMSPANNMILIAATDNGIWKSTDGGSSWQQKIAAQFDAFLDLEFKPRSVDTMYSCTNSWFYRTVDAGEHWTRITQGISVPSSGGKGMRLAVSDANPGIVYLGMIAKHGTVFRSEDSGSSFSKIYQDTVLQSLVTYNGLPGDGSNGNYNFAMTADPKDADQVYFGTQTLWKSIDGGHTWTSLYSYLSRVHPDIHDLRFSPADHRLFNLNDGGIAVSPDEGETWLQHNDGMEAAEIYNGGQSQLRRDIIVIGTQDNGSLALTGDYWKVLGGGDVFDAFWFDFYHADKYYSDRGASEGLETNKVYNLHFPLSILGNRKFAFTPADSNVAFLCQNEVWRSRDINSPFPSWTQITLPLSSGSSDYVRDMVVSPHDANELYVLLPNSILLYTDHALDPVPVFDTLEAPGAISYSRNTMVVSKDDPEVVYFAAYNQLFRSIDKGKHWTLMPGHLPDNTIVKYVLDDFSDDESMYALCDNRIYYRNDSIMDWVEYSQGLPSLAYISDLMIFNDGSRNSLLRVVTYGRGIFETPMYKPKPFPAVDFSANEQEVCTHMTVNFTDASQDATSWHWTFEGGTPATFDGQSPPPIKYDTPGLFEVSLTVSNAYGEVKSLKPNFISVKFHFPVPFMEGFEGNFPPSHIELASPGESNINWYQGYLGAFGQSAKSAIFHDSYTNAKADLQLNVDLSSLTSAGLTFDLAYARLAGNQAFDSLAVMVSTDCGQTFETLFYQGGSSLATMADVGNALAFNPGPADWKTEPLDLTPYAGNENVFVRFRAWGHFGEIMALDNIIIDGMTTAIPEPLANDVFTIIPNPAKGTFVIQAKSEGPFRLSVFDLVGDLVGTYTRVAGSSQQEINLSGHPAGMYFVVMESNGYSYSKLLILE